MTHDTIETLRAVKTGATLTAAPGPSIYSEQLLTWC